METRRLVIECAQNGFLVYVNQDFSAGTVRPIPYVFETMENLQEFIKLNFSDKRSASEKFKDATKYMEESFLKL